MTTSVEGIIAKLQELMDAIDQLPSRIKLAAQQVMVVTGLSDISDKLGLIRSGEFRAGSVSDPGKGFSGVRMGFPAFTYNDKTWHLVGISNDVLQFGLSADDGTAWAGAGAIRLTKDGIEIYNGSTKTGQIDADGDVFFGSDLSGASSTGFHIFAVAQAYNGESMGAGDILIGDNSATKPNLLWDKSAGAMYVRNGTDIVGVFEASSMLFGVGVRMRRDASQSIPSGSITAIQFDAEEFDDASYADIPTSATNITIPTDGHYSIMINVQMAYTTGGSVRAAYTYVNGVAYWPSMVLTSGFTVLNATDVRQLSAGDVVQLRVLQDSGGALNVLSASITIKRER